MRSDKTGLHRWEQIATNVEREFAVSKVIFESEMAGHEGIKR